MANDQGGPISNSSKNLGNVVGLHRGFTPPKEADGVTEKRYILWAKQYPTLPVTYKIHQYDFALGAWMPIGGVLEETFNLLKFKIFGTLNDEEIDEYLSDREVTSLVEDLDTKINTKSISLTDLGITSKFDITEDLIISYINSLGLIKKNDEIYYIEITENPIEN